MICKWHLVFVCLIIAILNIPANGQEAPGKYDLSFSIVGGGMYGYTLYRLEHMQLVPETDWSIGVKSELQFPLDMMLAGFRLQLDKRASKGIPWSLSIEYLTNLNDPHGAMEDTDWIIYSTYDYFKDMKFSYTKSDVDLVSHFAEAILSIPVLSKNKFQFTAVGGFQYRRYSFNVYGVDGWYINSQGRQINFVDYQNDKVGKYRAIYMIPYLGLGGELHYSKNTVYLLAKATPFVFADDFDDHLLRFKTGEGDCSGMFLAVESGVDWLLTKGDNLSNWAIEIRAEYSLISTNGEQIQTWYGDDPASEADDTGESMTLDDYDMASKTLMFKARLKYNF
ncbi:MAG: omptin family outer membrane protease [candidate division Zixibacteria bacterium]|nr:omptin family outer membrane protease [candidate division Zixibacteria bacterium]